jgi:hypothetical protein
VRPVLSVPVEQCPHADVRFPGRILSEHQGPASCVGCSEASSSFSYVARLIKRSDLRHLLHNQYVFLLSSAAQKCRFCERWFKRAWVDGGSMILWSACRCHGWSRPACSTTQPGYRLYFRCARQRLGASHDWYRNSFPMGMAFVKDSSSRPSFFFFVVLLGGDWTKANGRMKEASRTMTGVGGAYRRGSDFAAFDSSQ